MNDTSERPPLTVEILKTLKFELSMHVNGGSKFSKKITRNEQYKLALVTQTNGSPQYKLTEKRLIKEGSELELDLLKGIPDLAGFCEQYNQATK